MSLRKITFFVAAFTVLAGTIVLTNRSMPWAQSVPDGFTPPTKAERKSAIGSTQGLSRQLQKALEEDEQFTPISKPGPSDWLSAHLEFGQTFADFQRGQPNRPDQKRHTLYFVPLGDYDETVGPPLKSLEAFASAFFDLPVKILPALSFEELPIKIRQRSAGPDQLLSTDVLDCLKPLVPDDAFCLLAITMEDLYPDEKWNFVFGQASLRDRVGVYSFVRYTPQFGGGNVDASAPGKVLRRSCQVLGHETGHMFGIRHCIHFQCLMNGSNSLNESDRKPLYLCPVCLRKLQSSINFDVAERYKALKGFSEDAKWTDETKWLEKRLVKTSQ